MGGAINSLPSCLSSWAREGAAGWRRMRIETKRGFGGRRGQAPYGVNRHAPTGRPYPDPPRNPHTAPLTVQAVPYHPLPLQSQVVPYHPRVTALSLKVNGQWAVGRFSAPRGETLLLLPPRHPKTFKRARGRERPLGNVHQLL